MIKKLKKHYNSLISSLNFIQELKNRDLNDLKNIKVNIGQIQSHLNEQKNKIKDLKEVEFQIFSQFGDDGIIQYLISKIDIPNKIFIEFGVENYKESNTRFLLVKDKWSGLVIDGSKENIDFIKNDQLYSFYDLHAVHAFITKENINTIIKTFLNNDYSSDIGLLSIDIDGNDYWIWEAINVINPIIVIVEYNSLFGPDKSYTIPYKEDFYRLNEDKNYQYWGASISALFSLANIKGYDFVGCNSHGNNAYFIRKDKSENLNKFKPPQGYSKGLFREKFGEELEILSFDERLNLIKGKFIYNVEEKQDEVL